MNAAVSSDILQMSKQSYNKDILRILYTDSPIRTEQMILLKDNGLLLWV